VCLGKVCQIVYSKGMYFGIVDEFDLSSRLGRLVASSGLRVSFRYDQGQSLMIGPDVTIPRFTGRHTQPPGHILKLPAAGDVVIFEQFNKELTCWAYMSHFEMLALRPYGDSGKIA
jgi:hypothetical protein